MIDIPKARKIIEDATDGPWYVDRTYIKSKPRCVIAVVQGVQGSTGKERDGDKKFIAFAREALPEALDQIEILQAEIKTRNCLDIGSKEEFEALREENAELRKRLELADKALQFANQNMRPGLSGPHGDQWDKLLQDAWRQESKCED